MTYDRLAWLASNIMNSTGKMKKPMTPQKLLGKDSKKDVFVPDKADQVLELRLIQNEISRGRNGTET